jgi:hypothetical protein
MSITTQNDSDILLQIHKDNVEAIHAALEAQGGDVAKKSRELRVLYRGIINAASKTTQKPGFFGNFDYPIDAILAYLFIKGSPCEKNTIINDIVAGGFQGKTSGPKQAIQDSVAYQTNPQNNGKKNLFDNGNGTISLTQLGTAKAKKALAESPEGQEILHHHLHQQ